MSFLTYDVTKIGIFDVVCHEILDPTQNFRIPLSWLPRLFVDGIEGRLCYRDLSIHKLSWSRPPVTDSVQQTPGTKTCRSPGWIVFLRQRSSLLIIVVRLSACRI